MGHRQRVEAMDRAIAKGRAAFLEGKPAEANPYKRPTYRPRYPNGPLDGEWSLYSFWNLGWNQAKNEQ